ncbi:MAG: hypothetical protein ACRC0G_07585 [Fusobacteriaceae bacterium]
MSRYVFDLLNEFSIELDRIKPTGEVKYYKKGKKYVMTMDMVKFSYDYDSGVITVTAYETDFKTGDAIRFTEYKNITTPQRLLMAHGAKINTHEDICLFVNLDKILDILKVSWDTYAKINSIFENKRPIVRFKRFRDKPVKGADQIQIDHVMMHSVYAQEIEYFKEDWMNESPGKDDEQSLDYPEEIKEKISHIEEILDEGNPEKINDMFKAVMHVGGFDNV